VDLKDVAEYAIEDERTLDTRMASMIRDLVMLSASLSERIFTARFQRPSHEVIDRTTPMAERTEPYRIVVLISGSGT
jgi:hypothetical protein